MTFASEEGFILVRSLGPEAEVITLAVAPAARRRGLGRALVETAAAAVAAGGAEALFLEVAADNAPALALYESTGFVRAGHRRGYYARPPGPAVDALTLRRMLSPPAP
jgi:ribosomal-protein-alanine N-acetyltransferase